MWNSGCLSLLAVFLPSASCLAPLTQFSHSQCAGRLVASRCLMVLDEATSRRALLAGAIGVALGPRSAPAWAGYVTSLGIETTKPQDSEVDQELLKSKEVQKVLDNIKSYKLTGASLQSKFEADGNLNLIPAIRKEFDFAQVRDDLNVISSIFDEQTQLTMDRIARSILYDLTELENASRFKKGETERTAKKMANVEKWFGKLDADLTLLLSYL